jgi:hypothetical protein
MYIFKSTNLLDFAIFCIAYITKNFVIKFYMLVGYIIDCIQIYFHIFLQFRNIIVKDHIFGLS